MRQEAIEEAAIAEAAAAAAAAPAADLGAAHAGLDEAEGSAADVVAISRGAAPNAELLCQFEQLLEELRNEPAAVQDATLAEVRCVMGQGRCAASALDEMDIREIKVAACR